MAERLEAFDFTVGRGSSYPWGEWLDGSIWRLRRGTDFTCKAETLRNSMKTAAKKRNINVRVQIESEDSIVLKADLNGRR